MANPSTRPTLEQEIPVRYGEPEGGGCDQPGCSRAGSLSLPISGPAGGGLLLGGLQGSPEGGGGKGLLPAPREHRRGAGDGNAAGNAGSSPRTWTTGVPPWCMWVSRDLDEPVVERLVRWGDSNMSIINDPAIRYTRPDRMRQDPGPLGADLGAREPHRNPAAGRVAGRGRPPRDGDPVRRNEPPGLDRSRPGSSATSRARAIAPRRPTLSTASPSSSRC